MHSKISSHNHIPYNTITRWHYKPSLEAHVSYLWWVPPAVPEACPGSHLSAWFSVPPAYGATGIHSTRTPPTYSCSNVWSHLVPQIGIPTLKHMDIIFTLTFLQVWFTTSRLHVFLRQRSPVSAFKANPCARSELRVVSSKYCSCSTSYNRRSKLENILMYFILINNSIRKSLDSVWHTLLMRSPRRSSSPLMDR